MKSNLSIVLPLIMFVLFGFLASDMYVPSLPHIVTSLATTASMAKLTVTIYLLGLAVAPLILGPMADRYGRRPMALLGCALAILGSLMALSANDIYSLLAARLVQSIGFGGVLSMTRVVISDIFEGNEMAKVGGMISLATSFAPAVAPIIGGYLEVHLGWRSVFWVIAAGIIPLGAVIYQKLPETVKNLNPEATKLTTMVQNYSLLLKSRYFWAYIVASSFSIAAMVVYASMSPFIMQQIYHLSAVHFGWSMAAVSVMTIASRLLNIRLLNRYEAQKIIKIGLMLMALGSGAMMILSVLNVHFVMAVILPAMLMILGTGLVPVNVLVSLLQHFKPIAASVAALYGSMVMFGGFIATFVASQIPNQVVTMSILLALMSATALITVMLGMREQESSLSNAALSH